MGRWRTQAAATPDMTEQVTAPTAVSAAAVVDIDTRLAAREERLRAAGIQLEGPWSEEARDQAIRLRLRTSEPQAHKADSDAFGELARYLQSWAIGHGYLDPIEALRGPEIARWAAGVRRDGGKPGTLKTRRGRLVEVGRLFNPEDFRPGRSESTVSQADRLAPVPDSDLVMIRHYAALAPDDLRERFETIFAVVPWTGARPAELRRLRGTDIRRLAGPTGDVAIVTLTNSRGVSREVPVVDTDAASRLLELAATRGGQPIVRSGERNALNRCREYLKRRGVTVDFTVDRLRSAWLVRLASTRLPLAYALYLADTWDTRIFRQLQGHLPSYDLDQGMRLLENQIPGPPTRALGGGA